MKTVTLTRGLPASGKSTWAKEQVRQSENNTKRINKDDLRAMLDVSRFSSKSERFVERVRNVILYEALEQGFDVIIDDTNLNPKMLEQVQVHINLYKANTSDNNVQVVIKDLTDVPLEECLRRNACRDKAVPEDVIHKMYDKWLKNKL